MGKIGVGIIGCGGRARHLMNLVLQQTDNIELIAVRDPDAGSVTQALEDGLKAPLTYFVIDKR